MGWKGLGRGKSGLEGKCGRGGGESGLDEVGWVYEAVPLPATFAIYLASISSNHLEPIFSSNSSD